MSFQEGVGISEVFRLFQDLTCAGFMFPAAPEADTFSICRGKGASTEVKECRWQTGPVQLALVEIGDYVLYS